VPFWDILAFDKFAHMSVFLIFTLLLKVGFLKQHQYAILRYRVNVISISIAITYGILIEIIQGALLIDRFIELNDMIANAIGSVLGLLIFRLIYGNCINNK
jgi:VanZ family protein